MQPFLLSITINGIKNISRPVAINFYKNKNLNNFNPSQDRVRAIYGPNGSGKTALINGVWLASKLLRERNFVSSLGQEYFANIINKETNEFDFSCDYMLIEENKDGVWEKSKVFRYGFSIKQYLSDYSILNEKLNYYKGKYLNSDLINIFETINGKISLFDSELNGHYDDFKDKAHNVVSKESLLMFFFDYANAFMKENEIFSLMPDGLKGLYLFSNSLLSVLDNEDKHFEYFEINKNIKNSFLNMPEKDLNETLKKSVSSGLGFRVIVKKDEFDSFVKFTKHQEDFIKIFKPELKGIKIDSIDNGNEYICSETMNYGGYSINREFESTGIKKLLNLYSALYRAANGGIVFIDEIDANISGVYLKKLIEYMNTFGNGQLCFTSHSLDPMYVLSNKSKSIYFINGQSEVIDWTKNANYKPYILYPEGMIRGIHFDIEPFDFLKAFDLKTEDM